MKTIGSIILAVSLFTACSKGDVGELGKLKDEACACKDKACGEAVNKKLDAELDKLGKDGKEPDEATQTKLMSVMAEAGVCLAKLK
jgi:hypothetical protein